MVSTSQPPNRPRAVLRDILAQLQDPEDEYYSRYAGLFERNSPAELEEQLYGCWREDVLALFDESAAFGTAPEEDGASPPPKSDPEDAQTVQDNLEKDLDDDLDSDFEDSLISLCEEYEALALDQATPAPDAASASPLAAPPAAPPSPSPPSEPPIPTPLALHSLPAYPDSSSPPAAPGIYIHLIHPPDATQRDHLYTGQATLLSRRLAQHADFRYRRRWPSLHYAALEQSAADRFLVVTRPDTARRLREAGAKRPEERPPAAARPEPEPADATPAALPPRENAPRLRAAPEDEASEAPAAAPLDGKDDDADDADAADDDRLRLNILEHHATLLFGSWVPGVRWAPPGPAFAPVGAAAGAAVAANRRPLHPGVLPYRGLNVACPLDQEHGCPGASAATRLRSRPRPRPRRRQARLWEELRDCAADPVVRSYAEDRLARRRRAKEEQLEGEWRVESTQVVAETAGEKVVVEETRVACHHDERGMWPAKGYERDRLAESAVSSSWMSFSFGLFGGGLAAGLMYLMSGRRQP